MQDENNLILGEDYRRLIVFKVLDSYKPALQEKFDLNSNDEFIEVSDDDPFHF